MIQRTKFIFYFILSIAFWATLTAFAACNENKEIPTAKGVSQLPDWEDNISVKSMTTLSPWLQNVPICTVTTRL